MDVVPELLARLEAVENRLNTLDPKTEEDSVQFKRGTLDASINPATVIVPATAANVVTPADTTGSVTNVTAPAIDPAPVMDVYPTPSTDDPQSGGTKTGVQH